MGDQVAHPSADYRVTVITPHLRGRSESLALCKASVAEQTHPAYHMVMMDLLGEGPEVMRNRGMEQSESEWVAFLDDDDIMYPHHIEYLLKTAEATDADVIYPWFDLVVYGQIDNDKNPLICAYEGEVRSPFGVPAMEIVAQLEHHNFIPVTTLVRRSKALEVGGFPHRMSERWPHDNCEDWGFWRDMLAAGAKFHHLPERTWQWHWNGKNSSGKPENARAMGML